MTLADPITSAFAFNVDLEALLAPIPDGNGAGVSLRSEPIFFQIGEARREDDASVPMGEWERPLIKADWKAVATLSAEALRTRSKDFQLGAWLCEAWTHLYRIDGFIAGTQLLTGLAERYWDGAYPVIDEGDTDARVAPFVWINHTMALALSLHVPLIMIEGREPPTVSLDEFQRVNSTSATADGHAQTRELIDKHIEKNGNVAALVTLRQQLRVAREAWDTFSRLIDLMLDVDAPSFSAVTDMLARLSRATESLIGDRALPSQGAVQGEMVGGPAHADHAFTGMADAEYPSAGQSYEADGYSNSGTDTSLAVHSAMATATFAARPAASAITSLAGLIADRAHAYRLLGDIAGYLERHEPHSPTPYLLKRAVTWGQMPLPDLMEGILG